MGISCQQLGFLSLVCLLVRTSLSRIRFVVVVVVVVVVADVVVYYWRTFLERHYLSLSQHKLMSDQFH